MLLQDWHKLAQRLADGCEYVATIPDTTPIRIQCCALLQKRLKGRVSVDISYLLWLQGIREALPSFFESFFALVSAIAASSALVVLPCLLYWCLDKRGGEFLLFSFSMGSMCNQLIKNTVCAYRPWIRSPDIHPTEGSLAEATGYSFPSGHTQAAATLIGASGWRYRKKWPALNVACWVFVLLVAFSRNFLVVRFGLCIQRILCKLFASGLFACN